MHIAHLGVGIFVVGVTLSSAYSREKDVRMALGDTVTLGGYGFRFEGVSQVPGPNYMATRGTVRIYRGEREVLVLNPEKRQYRSQSSPMTEAAIDAGATRDLYVALGEPAGADAWSLRVYYKPFIQWIWLGALVMGIGGILAASDRRYRLAADTAGGADGVRSSARLALAGSQ